MLVGRFSSSNALESEQRATPVGVSFANWWLRGCSAGPLGLEKLAIRTLRQATAFRGSYAGPGLGSFAPTTLGQASLASDRHRGRGRSVAPKPRGHPRSAAVDLRSNTQRAPADLETGDPFTHRRRWTAVKEGASLPALRGAATAPAIKGPRTTWCSRHRPTAATEPSRSCVSEQADRRHRRSGTRCRVPRSLRAHGCRCARCTRPPGNWHAP